ncbi:MAG TPA: chemotaxis protein CheW [Clostridia bacterium]|nr:chemotaxis protein CheW [Clostridia bacterium]
MRIGRQTTKKHAVRHGEAVILFAVGPHTFAIAANEVDEIRDLQGLKPLRSTLAKVKQMLVRGKHTYFVVDASFHLCQLPSKASRVLILRNLRTAVAVDSIDRMMEVAGVQPLPQSFHGDERRWYRGLTLLGEAVVPVVNAAAFLTSSEIGLLQRQMKESAV